MRMKIHPDLCTLDGIYGMTPNCFGTTMPVGDMVTMLGLADKHA
jgi:hypothetical protein